MNENENYVIINGDRIASILSGDHGATYVWIICQEWDHPDFDCGEIIYAFEFVGLSDNEYVLKDDEGKHYTFVRIGESTITDQYGL
ncbi:MAG: hypothetical protein E7462_06240 [Ruminococcaceae bacterium]|nr:hypothetical protein [Oscillospiraceae bacterium]